MVNKQFKRCLRLILASVFAFTLNSNATAEGGALRSHDSIRLPDLGSPSDQYLTPAEEIRLGQAFMQKIRETQKVVDDPLIAEYVQDLGNKLLKRSEAAAQPFNFFVIEDPVINAFAGPGGHIGIFSGLILATQSESELASVIAHEIAHVTQKHLLRAFDAANQMSGKTAALILAAILVGVTTSSPDAGIAVASGVQASALQEQINFTRSNEQEADHVGIRILAESNFDPRAMPVFFERLTHASRLYESGIPEILRTHPVTTNRIADSLGRAEEYPYKQYTGSISYFLVREALRAKQFSNPDKAVKHFSSGLKEGRHLNKEAHQYGYVLALTASRDYQKARRLIIELLKQRPEQPEYILAEAEILKHSGQQKSALESLGTANLLMPDNYPIAITYIVELLESQQPAEAKQVIAKVRTLRPNDPRLFRLLGQSEKQIGNDLLCLGGLLRFKQLDYVGYGDWVVVRHQ
ncbi:MAG: M48 family metalloprotease [Gammaproteobacteria bacterium]|nr:M48 family metalloprotease [Gammaproteobacteria bacterium]